MIFSSQATAASDSPAKRKAAFLSIVSQRGTPRRRLAHPGQEHNMTKHTLAALAALALLSNGAHAAGCLKGAAVGGVAGHVAGHHAVVGAVGGCLVGRHLAKKDAEQKKAAADAAAQAKRQPPAPAAAAK